MEKALSDKTKGYISVLVIIVALILAGNTNNNPEPFIQRIFRSIRIANGAFHYAGLLLIIAIYNGVRGIGRFTKVKLSLFTKYPLIITIIITLLSSNLIECGVKVAKSFPSGLDSIYYNRGENSESKNLNLKANFFENKKLEINCSFELENMSNEERAFYINLYIPDFLKDDIPKRNLYAIDQENGNRKMFTLKGKEKKKIEATFVGSSEREVNGNSSSSAASRYFEFELFNENETVKFLEREINK